MASGRRSKALALDGGGVRGWSQILLLGRIIRQIKAAESVNAAAEETELYPCEYFDFIVGSGTGGINAILIGRLGMSIAEIKLAYKDLKNHVFSHVLVSSDEDTLFDDARLEQWAKDLVKKYTGNENSPMVPEGYSVYGEFGNTHRRACKVSVTSTFKDNVGGVNLLRSYYNPSVDDVPCTIWEAIRATTSFPVLFKPIAIGERHFEMEYIGCELGACNPIKVLKDEHDDLYADSRPYACIISIGTGRQNPVSLAGYRIENSDAEERLLDALIKTATYCEDTHRDFVNEIPDEITAVYFRFNVEEGLQKIEREPERKYLRPNVQQRLIQRSSLEESDRLDGIRIHTDAYLKSSEVKHKLDGLIDKLVDKLVIMTSDDYR